jgi:hypothetical protein
MSMIEIMPFDYSNVNPNARVILSRLNVADPTHIIIRRFLHSSNVFGRQKPCLWKTFEGDDGSLASL